ncbi:2-C-methyl-D-erythritol 2,4-cyclodiphosphate synthase [Stieleria sp. ICT_E10.1]|uniref:2-C-methyl-D-erythritol 2,4-cyclodiphosphate synthase n=1 Tax=Stieleria sedimenti TaxID=2976331 RepID=UPI00217FB00C|nr:2-C-methyl-D-erythritol 2,4-cyclodiphosphate synthase [Stieleria sedimenti]MCS7471208.1 2-C-methyl-D-erythritol 2,4-cyclodiphosphate synthase [Stieleria sedimenti]
MPSTPANVPNLRIGLGYDSHRLEAGGPLRIGGIDVPADLHAIGHSDADVLLHAITDALLGAICAADIGRLFPDTSDVNADRDSRDFVQAALDKVHQRGMGIVNLDCVILAERPKMAPHIDAMRAHVADMLGADADRVSIKAKTGEGVGEIGTGKSIATRVVVLLAGRLS